MNRRNISNRPGISLFEQLESRRLLSATPATDLLFGNAGVAYPGPVPNSSGPAPVVALQPDGKIVIADIGATALNVVRLNPDGTTDTSFGGSDGVSLGTDQPTVDFVQADGKILIATAPSPWASQGSLIRLNADGSLDTSFGAAGRVDVPASLTAIAQASDGSIYAAGTAADAMNVVHLLADGSLDSAFGNAGVLSFTATAGSFVNYGATKLLPTPDGKLVIVASEVDTQATAASQCLLARVNADGSIDSAFNGGQVVLGAQSKTYSVPTDAALLPDGSILIASRDSRTLSLTHYNFDGSLDSSFGSGGTATDSLGNNFMGGPLKLLVRDTGEIVVEGFGTEFAYNGHFTPTGQLLQSELTSVMPGVDPTSPTRIPSGFAIWFNTNSAIDSQGNLIAAANTAKADGSGWVYPLASVKLALDDYAWPGDPSFHWNPYPQTQPDPTPTTDPIPTALSNLRSARKALHNDLADLRARLHADILALRSTPHGPDAAAARAELRTQIKKDHAALHNQRHKDLAVLSAARHKLRSALRASRAK